MSNNLADVWFEVEALLNQGISIVPVRDKEEVYNGKLYKAKTPYREWKQYQYEIIDRAVLFDQMQKYNTTAIAMICGAISGNLEVIDFDVKYYPGIDAIIISAIRELYPDIFAKMRPHRTRSGGTHLVYRIENHEVPPSTHLCERLATDEEIELNPKSGKTRCYVETRGTGGMATAPPSLGYTIINNIQIQALTWEERCSIIELIKSYNEYIPEQKPYKPPASEINYYDENPFEHYNRTVDPVELFSQFGWTFVKKHGDYIWFTRPDGRPNEVHAGFNLNKCTFRVWGTKSDLDSERSYTPSTILAHYQFNDDKSLAYYHLVQQGYGRIKPSMELKIARKKAIEGMPMPTNASPRAVEEYTTLVIQLQTAHPHGIYWYPDEEHGEQVMRITRLGFKDVATKLGFRLFAGDLVQIVEQFIHRCDERFFFDTMRRYIKEEDADTYELIYNATQAFLQKNGKFEISQLDILSTDTIVQDTRTTCFKFYTNGYVLITAQSYELLEYETLNDKLIWHEKIQQREFVFCPHRDRVNDNEFNNGNGQPIERGLYTRFLELACDLDNNREHIMKCIGYLVHDYKDESLGYIIVLTEQCENPDDGGGTGKNLFGSLLNLTTSYTSVPGSQVQLNEKFLQSWNGERIFCVSDAEVDFRFGFLKDLSTGKVIIKKLFKDEKTFHPNLLPKFIVNTNFSYDIKDGGLKRRIIHIEFTDFFTQAGGIQNHFGKMFPHDWDENDYSDYDNFICESVKIWLNDLKLKKLSLSQTGWEKQFLLNYNTTIVSFIKSNWEFWRQREFISNADFNKQIDEHLIELNIPLNSKFRPSSTRINKALNDWCIKQDYSFHKDSISRDGLNIIKGRKFLPNDPPF